ncbi:MAG: hypothetical protein AAFN11_13300 [Chloroflexota bacterium]
MMNVQSAKKIHKRVAQLAETATIFYAKFGANYQMTEDSPARAWELYKDFMTRQAQIASLLSNRAIANPYVRWERWWENRDVMNIALVNELGTEALRLVERVSYLHATNQPTANELSIEALEQSIAGLLHPITRQQKLAHHDHEMPKAI